MKRLFFTIYATLIGALALFAVLISLSWVFFADPSRFTSRVDFISKTAESVLPKTSTPNELETILNQWSDLTRHNLGVFTKEGKPIALSSEFDKDSKLRQVILSGDRILKFSSKRLMKNPLNGAFILIPLGLLGLAVALAAYPLMCRITRRLEKLSASVVLMGEQRGVRVKIEGKDEIATLAKAFNATSQKIDNVITAQKLLLANASHEFRSPLTRLKLAVESLKGEQQQALKQEINTNIRELDALIEEVLLNSRLEAKVQPLNQEIIDLKVIIDTEIGNYKATFATDNSATYDMIGEARLIRRVVRNLLENAIKYGTSAHVTLENSYNLLLLKVSDQGNGIAKGDENNIFAPFFRQKGISESQGGVGLGLTLVKQITEQHNGNVRVYNNEQGGATFELTFPKL